MIKSITLNNVACYKHSTTLNTDKYVNLIYGLNGSGKSTLSKYLKNLDDARYCSCSIDGYDSSQEILVYNTDFIRENFYESTQQKGIFTLSKENKEVGDAINKAKQILVEKETELNKARDCKTEAENSKRDKNNALAGKVWEIKTKYSGGDRVLEYCLDGLKGNKVALLSHLLSVEKSQNIPKDTVDILKDKLQSISGTNAQKYALLNEVSIRTENIESNGIFQKVIVGNENSSVSQLITELKNSDWVRAGLQYLPEIKDDAGMCPFCQQKTVTAQLVESIKNYFDESYDKDLKYLKVCLTAYNSAIQSLPPKEIYEGNPKFEPHKKDFELSYSNLINALESNKSKIEEKIGSPSMEVSLVSTSECLESLNSVIQQINADIQEHNHNLDQIDDVKNAIKAQFWQIMRWEYDADIAKYDAEIQILNTNIDAAKSQIDAATDTIEVQNRLIADLQKQTVNVDEAIDHINSMLDEIGITAFQVIKSNENFYKIKRDDASDNVFTTLSEGEKMLISFLYFVELCKGKKSSSEIEKKKIIVIDDPMSSLSSIYVYNIGRLIKKDFFPYKDKKGNSCYPYEQIFILTHSLYFFYELTEINKDRREESQRLFRLQKNENGTDIKEMKYEEIQNDYQVYWSVIKDENQPVALIANCMRNIVEYFFNFIEKTDLNNCFLKPELSNNRYQALYRYINRESHSIGQNISDFKELDYADMKDAFRALFVAAGYEKHYNKMYGIKDKKSIS